MSILSREDRKDLVYSMRKSLLEQVRQNDTLTESKMVSAENYILNEASYNELLNLTWNEDRDTELQESEVLEAIAIDSYNQLLAESTEAEGELVEESVFGMVEDQYID